MKLGDHQQHLFRPWVVKRGGIAEEIGRGLGIRGRKGVQNSEQKEAALIALLTDLYYRKSIAVSMRANYYSYSSPYIPIWHSRANVWFAVEELLAAELVVLLVSSPEKRGHASTLFALPKLLSMFNAGEKPLLVNKELVQLRDGDGNALDYNESSFTKDRRHKLTELNEFSDTGNFIYNPHITLTNQYINHPLHPSNFHTPPYDTDSPSSPKPPDMIDYGSFLGRELCNSMHTVFNKDFSHGGRLYTGTGAQNIKRGERKTITINGGETVEPDFSAMHLRMLYALKGIQYNDDGYLAICEELGGLELRPLVKLCFNTAINALGNEYNGGVIGRLKELRKSTDPDKVAEGELMWELIRTYNLTPYKVLEKIKSVHKPIAEYLASGIGAELQRVDGEIALDTMVTLMGQGIHSSGVHDSMIAQAAHQTQTVDAMHESYSKHMNGFTAIIDI